MNPFFERTWNSVHTALIGFIWEEVSSQLPADLITRPEERIVIDEEQWKTGLSPAWQSARTQAGAAVLEPQIVLVEEHPERWIEIRTADGTLVTVIELLSPTNKQGGWEAYRSKQRQILESTANLVEIDLLRGGHPAPATTFASAVPPGSSPERSIAAPSVSRCLPSAFRCERRTRTSSSTSSSSSTAATPLAATSSAATTRNSTRPSSARRPSGWNPGCRPLASSRKRIEPSERTDLARPLGRSCGSCGTDP